MIEIDNGEITDYSFRTLHLLKNLNHFNIQIYVENSRPLYFIHLFVALDYVDSGRANIMRNVGMLERLLHEVNTLF